MVIEKGGHINHSCFPFYLAKEFLDFLQKWEVELYNMGRVGEYPRSVRIILCEVNSRWEEWGGRTPKPNLVQALNLQIGGLDILLTGTTAESGRCSTTPQLYALSHTTCWQLAQSRS